MIILRKYILLLCGAVTVLILSGCSSSSSSQRYSASSKKTKPDTLSSKRYSLKPKIDKPDTMNYEEYEDDDEEIDSLLLEEEDVLVDRLMQRFYEFENENLSDSVNSQELVIMEIIKYLDTPYRYGGNNESGIDCSAFTRTIFHNIFSLQLPRTARDQYTLGEEVGKQELKFGDLVFFNTRRRVIPGHVGIYIGDNLFAHASRKRGVTVSSLEEDYYSRKFMGGRRLENLPLQAD